MPDKLAYIKLTVGDKTVEDRRRFINASDAEIADWCRCQYNRLHDIAFGLNVKPAPVVKRVRRKKCDK